MENLKAIIIEDNEFMATVLSDMIEQNQEHISVVGVAKTGREGLRLVLTKKPNVVFLDIELPDMTGFEMLSQLENIEFQTIFTTAHSHYAIKAFRFNALDYLVKPIRENELNDAISRCLQSSTNRHEIRNALMNLETKKVIDQKLSLYMQKGTLQLPLKQITYVEGDRNYSYINLSNGKKELSSKTLAYFEDILEKKGFFRCHRSFLLNGYHIREIKMDVFVLKSDMEIPIARRRKTAAKNWFNTNYNGD